jgi:hypothetical protein
VTKTRIQPDLFGDDRRPDDASALVAAGDESSPLTKGQQTFNRLVAAIRRDRANLARWQAFETRYRQRVAAEVVPLLAELQAAQKEMAQLLDDLLRQPTSKKSSLGRRERKHLERRLLDLLRSVIAEGEADPDLVAMHDRYSPVSREDLRLAEVAMTEAMLEGLLGEGVLGQHDAKSVDELLEHAGERVREAQRQIEERSRARSPRRKQSAEARQAEENRARAEMAASQSVRDVYRKLASALHPDRETDAAERARKTRLMQRVNQAYERNDLLGLLGLQIEIEQIDTEHLAQVSEDRINHYNRVLKEQLAQLRTEIAACAAPFRAMLDAPFASSRPTTALAEERLEAELRETRRVLDQLRHDLVAFRDPVQLRATVQADLALRGDQRRQDAAMGEFADLLRTMATTAPRPVRPRRRR